MAEYLVVPSEFLIIRKESRLPSLVDLAVIATAVGSESAGSGAAFPRLTARTGHPVTNRAGSARASGG